MHCSDHQFCSSKGAAGAKVLVIEDDADLQVIFYETLQLKGFQVLLASDGKIGLWMAEELMPDLIVSDINLPGMNGYEVLKCLRQNSKTVNIPFIFCSGEAQSDYASKGMLLGAKAYLIKPVDVNVLIDTVKAHLVGQDCQSGGLFVPLVKTEQADYNK